VSQVSGEVRQRRPDAVGKVRVEFVGWRRTLQQEAEGGAMGLEDGQVEGLLADVDQGENVVILAAQDEGARG